MRRLTGLLLAATVAAAGCGRTVNPADWTVTIEPIALPAAPGSNSPQLTTSSRGTILSWIELAGGNAGGNASLKFAERTGSGWTAPRTIVSGSDWFLSWADVPSVIRLDNGTLVANFLPATDARVEAYDLHLTYSKDEGKTWAPSFKPHSDGTTTQHGFASLVQMPGAGLGVMWLDGRDIATSTDFAGGNMAVRFAQFDANWKQTADMQVDGKVCECCPTSAVVTDDGVLTAFRDRDDNEIRDIHVSRLENGKWTAPVPVHKDNWEIYACPVNGAMLSARGRTVAAAWFTVKNDQGQAYAAFSNDAGRTWGTPIRLDDAGSTGRVDIELLENGRAVATWIEFVNQRSELRLRLVDPGSARSPAITVSERPANGYPRLTRQGNELILAWTESAGEDASVLKTAIARLP
jgi:hypothetical protein